MQHSNFCRQAIRSLEHLSKVHRDESVRECQALALNTIRASEKFLLPDGGRVLGDMELRGLIVEDVVSLPFSVIAMEYREYHSNRKMIVLATQKNETILLQHVGFAPEVCGGLWYAQSEISIPRTNFVRFSNGIPVEINATLLRPSLIQGVSERFWKEPAAVLLSMLNALSCANVRTELSHPKKRCSKPKSALPFDSYHILTVSSSLMDSRRGAGEHEHRSPREHLRRGHIRRLGDGRRIWVNATVVAAGRGAGVVTKDYSVIHNQAAA